MKVQDHIFVNNIAKYTSKDINFGAAKTAPVTSPIASAQTDVSALNPINSRNAISVMEMAETIKQNAQNIQTIAKDVTKQAQKELNVAYAHRYLCDFPEAIVEEDSHLTKYGRKSNIKTTINFSDGSSDYLVKYQHKKPVEIAVFNNESKTYNTYDFNPDTSVKTACIDVLADNLEEALESSSIVSKIYSFKNQILTSMIRNSNGNFSYQEYKFRKGSIAEYKKGIRINPFGVSTDEIFYFDNDSLTCAMFEVDTSDNELKFKDAFHFKKGNIESIQSDSTSQYRTDDFEELFSD